VESRGAGSATARRPTCALYYRALSDLILVWYLANMPIPPANPLRKRLFAVVLSFICITLPGIAYAGTHWVSPTGTVAWSSCTGSTPLSGTSACSLTTANSNAAAGDIVNFRAGTYTGTIQPSHSGSSASNRITFQAYSGETVTFSNGSPDVELSGNSYVSIKGFVFSDTKTPIQAVRIESGANHNELANNTISNSAGGSQGALLYLQGALNENWVTHNWIHDNTFTVTGAAGGGTGCTDGSGDTIIIGQYISGNTTEADNYNTFDNNVVAHGPHAAFSNYGMYNVIRNNVFHNEPWSPGCTSGQNSSTYSSSNPNYTAYNGMFGHRDIQISEDYNREATYVLLEGNRFGYAGVNQNNDGADDFSLAAPQNIVRYNFLYASMNPGLMFKYNWNSGLSGGGHGGTYNRVYNNTFYQNGYGYPWAWPTSKGGGCTLSYCPWTQTAISIYNAGGGPSGSGLGNVLKNNIFYQSSGYTNFGTDIQDKAGHNGWSEISWTLNNWCSGPQTGGNTDANGNTGCSNSGDPKFTNPDLSNPASTTLPDLSLQSSSGAIDGGTYLTTATNAGTNSTTLTVADALYFQDGTWGSDLAKTSAGLGGTMQADWVAIGTVSNVVQISSITYGTYNSPAGTITLASPMTWSDGAHIWLYKKSDGSQVLYGSAPDYGASEYNGSTGGAVAPPTGLAAVVN